MRKRHFCGFCALVLWVCVALGVVLLERPALSWTTQSSVWANAGDCTKTNCSSYLDFVSIFRFHFLTTACSPPTLNTQGFNKVGPARRVPGTVKFFFCPFTTHSFTGGGGTGWRTCKTRTDALSFATFPFPAPPPPIS